MFFLHSEMSDVRWQLLLLFCRNVDVTKWFGLTPELTATPRRGPNSEPKLLGGCCRTPGWAADWKRVALALGFSLFLSGATRRDAPDLHG